VGIGSSAGEEVFWKERDMYDLHGTCTARCNSRRTAQSRMQARRNVQEVELSSRLASTLLLGRVVGWVHWVGEAFTSRESQGQGKGGVVGSLRRPGSVGPGVVLAVFSTSGLLVLLCARRGVDGLLEPNCDGPIGEIDFQGEKRPLDSSSHSPIGDGPLIVNFVGMYSAASQNWRRIIGNA
jgi:hypothetical protein